MEQSMNNTQTATINGVSIAYRVAGSGPALVVQPPGWGIGSGLYQQTYAPLEDHYTVIYYDTRGSGESERAVDPATINVGQFVADLDELCNQLGVERFALTGHSHGGYIALNYALRHPARLTHLLPVDAQVGVAEPGEDLRRTLPQLAQLPRYADAAQAFMGGWDLDSDADFGRMLQRVLPLYFQDVNKGAPVIAGVAQAPPAVATFIAANASDEQFLVRDRLREITTPTLVLVGRHDFICSPVQAEIIRQGVPNATLHVFEQSGHFPWIEEPDAFFSAVRAFLDA
jgi:pimeloyl-ACP methyl ester carboxylesterase